MTRVMIIAEAGVNHNGSLALALQLIDAAVHAGADAVKFQTFEASKLVSAQAQKADYQISTTGAAESQFEMLKKLELSPADHHAIVRHCLNKKIQFLSTPFDLDSMDLLSSLGMSTFKIPSGEITNLPYLRKVGGLAKEVILSTGMANLGEVEAALTHLTQAGLSREQITVLHATTEYPCPPDEVNLRAMHTMRDAFQVKVGYSDHTEGIAIALAAVALGAVVIEKHITLSKTMPGPDHRASIEPHELQALVKGVREISSALGNGIKVASRSEIKNRVVARKSIVAAVKIQAGEQFSAQNLTVKRPGDGISPMRWDDVIGQTARQDYAPDDQIQF